MVLQTFLKAVSAMILNINIKFMTKKMEVKLDAVIETQNEIKCSLKKYKQEISATFKSLNNKTII